MENSPGTPTPRLDPEAGLITGEQLAAMRRICERLASTIGTIPPTHLNTSTDIIAALSSLADICSKHIRRSRQDQKELQEARHELENVEHLKSRFIRNVSHELRTPLASIDGFVRVLLQMEKHEEKHGTAVVNGRTSETRQQFLSIISQEVQRLGKLIEDVLDLSEIEGNRRRKESAQVSARSLFHDAVTSLQSLQPLPKVILRLKPEPDGPSIYADREAMIEVFRQLINNAFKFSGGQEIVLGAELVSISPENPSAASESGQQHKVNTATRLYVKDKGIGIPREELNRIFEKFHRVEKASTFPGTGLGLSIVRALVNHNNGQVWADSEIGKGSTFYVLLPNRSPGA